MRLFSCNRNATELIERLNCTSLCIEYMFEPQNPTQTYLSKGMDVSFSGIMSHMEDLARGMLAKVQCWSRAAVAACVVSCLSGLAGRVHCGGPLLQVLALFVGALFGGGGGGGGGGGVGGVGGGCCIAA
jgi:hypothetical protein